MNFQCKVIAWSDVIMQIGWKGGTTLAFVLLITIIFHFAWKNIFFPKPIDYSDYDDRYG